ncbi:hypothetical protein FH972_016746 [Carpinus fangiana]|uniref:TROVE domain-containing protein n=1 Tax=Carpinus fangiana TaxID=176857 RepID=A0A5N6RGU3_9ROSI|nr:hypothetical protein FH972_016746 [Carpinus fangiana]
MASAGRLLGPPAAGDLFSTQNAGVGSIVPRIDDLHLPGKPFNDDDYDNAYGLYDEEPPMGLTENFAPTFLSSGNPCLDFFFQVVPNTPSEYLIKQLQLAWAQDARTTLKLICNLRGVRGTGKSDKKGFYTSALWLHKTHPKTLALNVKALADFGYLKDLPEILYRLLEGPDVRERAKQAWACRKMEKKIVRRRESFLRRRASVLPKTKSGKFKRRGSKGGQRRVGSEEEKKTISKYVDKEKAKDLRKERLISMAAKALDRYNNDSNYRFLFDCVCDLFAELLNSDVAFLGRGEVHKITLAGKWCPTIDSSYDKSLLICEGIARRVFPREEYEGIEEAHYVYRVRDRLRKQVLAPLHKALQLPEVYMTANEWSGLPYNRVASVAMKTYKWQFRKHDKERFEEYLGKVKSGKANIAAGALLPHEIIKSLLPMNYDDDDDDEDGDEVAELQWERMVSDVAKKGKLKNCIAVCDVSGSMDGTPMEVCVALGLLVSELSEEPWKGKVITFSANPQLHLIKGDSLLAKTNFIRKMEWGGNTDFQKVFDQILQVAVEGKLTEDQLIKRVFVFSDMEFDEASGQRCVNYYNYYGYGSYGNVDRGNDSNSWETDYEVIQRKFREKGYNRVPEIVFWNLRHSSSVPVVASQSGVALVSGFSKNMLTVFLNEGRIQTPEDVMELALSGEEYKKLVVYD